MAFPRTQKIQILHGSSEGQGGGWVYLNSSNAMFAGGLNVESVITWQYTEVKRPTQQTLF